MDRSAPSSYENIYGSAMTQAEEPNSLRDRVAGWLEDAGLALELRVARAFATGGASDVLAPHYYFDTKGAKWREADVVASYTGERDNTRWELVVVAECKHAREKPWVG